MIGQIRNSNFGKTLWGLMAIYLLNISVDTADPNPEYIPEDLSFNDQESIVEIIIEKILGYEDAIEEYDDHDTEDHNNKKNVKVDLLVHLDHGSRCYKAGFLAKKQRFPNYAVSLTNGFSQIDTPPPKI